MLMHRESGLILIMNVHFCFLDSDSSGSDSDDDVKNEIMEEWAIELNRKQEHPQRLHKEVWHNEPGMVGQIYTSNFKFICPSCFCIIWKSRNPSHNFSMVKCFSNRRGHSNENPQHMFLWRNNKNLSQISFSSAHHVAFFFRKSRPPSHNFSMVKYFSNCRGHSNEYPQHMFYMEK